MLVNLYFCHQNILFCSIFFLWADGMGNWQKTFLNILNNQKASQIVFSMAKNLFGQADGVGNDLLWLKLVNQMVWILKLCSLVSNKFGYMWKYKKKPKSIWHCCKLFFSNSNFFWQVKFFFGRWISFFTIEICSFG